MCSTCNYKQYMSVYDSSKIKLQKPLCGNLAIRCDVDGSNYKIIVTDNPKGEFKLYACPTCGRRLT